MTLLEHTAFPLPPPFDPDPRTRFSHQIGTLRTNFHCCRFKRKRSVHDEVQSPIGPDHQSKLILRATRISLRDIKNLLRVINE